MLTNLNATINTTAQVFFYLCAIGGAVGLCSVLYLWLVDVGAKALGVHKVLLDYIWTRYRHKVRLNPAGLPYAIRTLKDRARESCTASDSEPCIESYVTCPGCAARLSLDGMGIEHPISVESAFLARFVPAEIARIESETGYRFTVYHRCLNDLAEHLITESPALSDYTREQLIPHFRKQAGMP